MFQGQGDYDASSAVAVVAKTDENNSAAGKEGFHVFEGCESLAGMSTIYVIDHVGQWRSDVSKLLDYFIRPEAPGRSLIEQIQPDKR